MNTATNTGYDVHAPIVARHIARPFATIIKIKKSIKQLKMSNWSNNNRACTTTWTTLFRMGQIRTNFSDSGKLPIGELTFYSNLASAELRKQEATIIADQMDNIFRLGRGAVYEDKFTRTKSLTKMVGVLVTEDKTVADLAKTIDDCYLFWQESPKEKERLNQA